MSPQRANQGAARPVRGALFLLSLLLGAPLFASCVVVAGAVVTAVLSPGLFLGVRRMDALVTRRREEAVAG